jgi:hypothetical protein
MLTLLLLASSALASGPAKCNTYVQQSIHDAPLADRQDIYGNSVVWITDRGKTITVEDGFTDTYAVKSIILRGERISLAHAKIRGVLERHYVSHLGEKLIVDSVVFVPACGWKL